MTDINKRLCELLELPFDEREGRYGHNQVNPKFQSPEGRIDLLRRMLGRDDWKSFLACLIGYKEPFWYAEPIMIKLFLTEVICNDTGSLTRAAVEFLTKEVNARRNINARVISPTGSRYSSPATTTINKGLL